MNIVFVFLMNFWSHHCLLILFIFPSRTIFPNTFCRNLGNVWIGYRRDKPKHPNNWYWTSGSKSTFTKWAPNMPDNFGGGEECTELYLNDDHTWNDESCATKNNFVCEKGLFVFMFYGLELCIYQFVCQFEKDLAL